MKARLGIAIGALVVLTSCANDNPVAPKPTPSSLTVSCGVTGFTTVGVRRADREFLYADDDGRQKRDDFDRLCRLLSPT